jgi:RNA:NAD 2'-phosphotransferase (TPT1/KptA family)
MNLCLDFKRALVLSSSTLNRTSLSDRQADLTSFIVLVLQHRASLFHLKKYEDKSVNISELLNLNKLKGLDAIDLEWLVDNDSLSQLAFTARKKRLRVCRNLFEPVRMDTNLQMLQFPLATCMHATHRHAERSILDNGIYTMKRDYIRFASQMAGDIQSYGKRDAELLIYVDMHHAMVDGIKFYLAENGAIFSYGDADGKILPLYFVNIVHLSIL